MTDLYFFICALSSDMTTNRLRTTTCQWQAFVLCLYSLNLRMFRLGPSYKQSAI